MCTIYVMKSSLPIIDFRSKLPQCEGKCPCPPPESTKPGGCTEFCIPLEGPIPEPELPEHCLEMDGQIEDEDAFVQDACRRRKNQLRLSRPNFCYQVSRLHCNQYMYTHSTLRRYQNFDEKGKVNERKLSGHFPLGVAQEIFQALVSP